MGFDQYRVFPISTPRCTIWFLGYWVAWRGHQIVHPGALFGKSYFQCKVPKMEKKHIFAPHDLVEGKNRKIETKGGSKICLMH